MLRGIRNVNSFSLQHALFHREFIKAVCILFLIKLYRVVVFCFKNVSFNYSTRIELAEVL